MISTQKNNFIKKLLYQSKNRGYKENDIILGRFAERFLNDMNDEDLANFEIILEQDDADIYNWVTKKIQLPEKSNSKIMRKLLKFNFNEQ
jgi:antitoxin CptB